MKSNIQNIKSRKKPLRFRATKDGSIKKNDCWNWIGNEKRRRIQSQSPSNKEWQSRNSIRGIKKYLLIMMKKNWRAKERWKRGLCFAGSRRVSQTPRIYTAELRNVTNWVCVSSRETVMESRASERGFLKPLMRLRFYSFWNFIYLFSGIWTFKL